MGGTSFGDVVPDMVFLNQKGRRFVDISQASGMSSVQKGHSVTVADFNNDGYVDVLKAFGGPAPADRFVPSLHLNPGGFGNHFVEFKLEGTQSNRAAIGARVRVTVAASKGEQKDFYGVVGNTSSYGSAPLRLHLGLGKATKIESVEIRWPNKTGSRQTFQNMAVDSVYYVKEGAEQVELRPLLPVKMKTKANGHHHHE